MAPATLEQDVTLCECGESLVDGKCVSAECVEAAKSALPSGTLTDSVAVGRPATIPEPRAFTSRGSVD